MQVPRSSARAAAAPDATPTVETLSGSAWLIRSSSVAIGPARCFGEQLAHRRAGLGERVARARGQLERACMLARRRQGLGQGEAKLGELDPIARLCLTDRERALEWRPGARG